VIFGAGLTGHAVAKVLAQSHRLGLKPIAFLDDDPLKIGTYVHDVEVVGPLEGAGVIAEKYRDAVAIIAMPGLSPDKVLKVLEGYASEFQRVIIIPDLFGMSSLWISAFDLGGILGLELHQKLLDKRRQMVKRAMELGLILIFLPVILPLMLLLAFLIKLDSSGPFSLDMIG
jgi:FlaA1/EpsC-like NDP-sugar epimerase